MSKLLDLAKQLSKEVDPPKADVKAGDNFDKPFVVDIISRTEQLRQMLINKNKPTS